MKNAKSILSIILITLSVIFLLQNMVTVRIEFLIWSLAVPRALMVVILIGIGFIIGLLVSNFSNHSKLPNPPTDNP
ncbi:lipopolysaccharide assembly protein LapA domain-containing protein [Hydrogenovibrio sp. 3SP14C1]|uniref:lipopolysaccharide assembly protein LapA domain-containing protein n=1 Tax=Hydrogenovibrio sp. 3SP14C1 TaxID=3038774 RepID=UPI0024168E63|nr:lipopolysaccharide assembly protein LapA domain-containing protein [Hydrogenovibrio sp. 3SP14C1]MDG4811630.1 lipopolysaccharide assembly protein LapA domain-containing protein [Hydrogenovibrio sp. 3SP14C1]